MPPLRKVGDRRAANWKLSSKNSRRIYVLIGDLALTNMGLGDKAAALALSERAMAANPIEKDAVTPWTGPFRSEIFARRGGGGGAMCAGSFQNSADRAIGRFTETSLDPR